VLGVFGVVWASLMQRNSRSAPGAYKFTQQNRGRLKRTSEPSLFVNSQKLKTTKPLKKWLCV